MDIVTYLLAGALLLALAALAVVVRQGSSRDMVLANERLERELRQAIGEAATQVRVETSARIGELQSAQAAHDLLLVMVMAMAMVMTHFGYWFWLF